MLRVRFAGITATFDVRYFRWSSSQPLITKILNNLLPIGGVGPGDGDINFVVFHLLKESLSSVSLVEQGTINERGRLQY